MDKDLLAYQLLHRFVAVDIGFNEDSARIYTTAILSHVYGSPAKAPTYVRAYMHAVRRYVTWGEALQLQLI